MSHAAHLIFLSSLAVWRVNTMASSWTDTAGTSGSGPWESSKGMELFLCFFSATFGMYYIMNNEASFNHLSFCHISIDNIWMVWNFLQDNFLFPWNFRDNYLTLFSKRQRCWFLINQPWIKNVLAILLTSGSYLYDNLGKILFLLWFYVDFSQLWVAFVFCKIILYGISRIIKNRNLRQNSSSTK